MPIEGYDFVVGCGSLNMIRWRDEYVRLFDRLRTNRIAVRVYDPEVIRTRKSVARFIKAVELMDSSHNVVLADLYKAGHDEYEHDFGAVYSFPPMEELIKLARGYDYSCQVAMSDEQHFPILKLTR